MATGIGRFRTAIEYVRSKPAKNFILTLLGCVLITDILSLPVFFAFHGFSSNEGIPDVTPIEIIAVWVLAGPIAETLLDQLAPIYLISRFTRNPWINILPSAVIFSVPHGFDDPSRIFPSFLGGIILAFSFWHWSAASIKKAFLVTFTIHALHNLITLIPLWLLKPIIDRTST